MQKRYLPITLVTGILVLIAMGGYLVPASSDGPPVRTVLRNKGGTVILNHAGHTAVLQEGCSTCHHTSSDMEKNPPPCDTCHAQKFDDNFATNHQKIIDKKLCVTCHHPSATIELFSHDEHAETVTDGDCQSCHHEASIEPTPQSCRNCHMDGSNSVPSLQTATHTRCADCHDDLYALGITGCSNCHTRRAQHAGSTAPQPCSRCHDTPLNELTPTSMDAYHQQCMRCHENEGKGPFGDDTCSQCHMN
ncbi:cytochrome C [Pseudodesulfovibrio sp. JC047]|uniref:cytochrome c3 family protein n=1 Tax=Pseudodesulfovibrio sp. JC047 TaxID=2683199 RepID=UPI0013CFF8FD|nr:cytochrome c3 family protein [Pseudodesulfovibrio sp. JC047]NDV20574.1 cytochrome C [Pseudodesulfovibrio sp. JC047]